ncbi:recombinase family protein [Prochlorothrix hollandica]|uniref:recombinase family protein n=1 Tax=Prochlorothrix hollandica TaxID=1223 RepID=UPI0003480565|nr:recombinase family protein [Prochlorothrix hollandica]
MEETSPKNLSVWERLERGRQAKASTGGYVGYGSPAFGQRSVNGELVDDPVECQVIELIRRHHKSGKSLQKIADWLNYQGYTTKRGQPWQRISVKRVLDRLYGKTGRSSEDPGDPDQTLDRGITLEALGDDCNNQDRSQAS